MVAGDGGSYILFFLVGSFEHICRRGEEAS